MHSFQVKVNTRFLILSDLNERNLVIIRIGTIVFMELTQT